MKKRILSLIASIVLILVAVVGLRNSRVVEAVDNAVLLENRHPGYWEYLSPGKMVTIRTNKLLNSISEADLETHNILNNNTYHSGTNFGVSTQSFNGEYFIKGIAESEIYSGITDDWIMLDPGTYFISVRKPSVDSKVTFTLQGFKKGIYRYGVDDIADLSSTQLFSVNGTYDTYKLAYHISKGEKIDSQYYPVIYKLSDDVAFDTNQWLTIGYWDCEMNSISDKEMELFRKDLARLTGYQYAVINDNGNCNIYSYATLDWTKAKLLFDKYGKATIN